MREGGGGVMEGRSARAVTKDASNSIEHVVGERVPIDEQASDLSTIAVLYSEPSESGKKQPLLSSSSTDGELGRHL